VTDETTKRDRRSCYLKRSGRK